MTTGQSISHYRILHRLGAGGMGEVYEAEDTDLHRKVAVKILPRELAAKPETVSRFKREARALAALSHPNIVTIYAVEQADENHFLAMELVKGRPLSDLIPKGGFHVEKLVTLAIPLTDALAAAHAEGIAHRDLKPSNVMVDDQGRVKVIDFGLAKLFQPDTGAVDIEASTFHPTGEGITPGTPAYMSPEQIEGRKLDHRTDIFSLGILLWEMATGQRPFKGNTPISVMFSILQHTPEPLTKVKASLPEDLGRIVRRCLEKDPDKRYQSALDVRNELERLKDPTKRAQRSLPPLVWKAAAAVVVAILLLCYLRFAGEGMLPGLSTKRLAGKLGNNPAQAAVAFRALIQADHTLGKTNFVQAIRDYELAMDALKNVKSNPLGATVSNDLAFAQTMTNALSKLVRARGLTQSQPATARDLSALALKELGEMEKRPVVWGLSSAVDGFKSQLEQMANLPTQVAQSPEMGQPNAAPTIEPVTNLPALEVGQAARLVPLTVSDARTAVASLNLEANSDSEAVVRAAAKLVQGHWQVELSPLKEGNAMVTVVARDQEGLKSAPMTFAVTVSKANGAPTIDPVTNLPALEVGQAVKLVPLTTSDDRTAVASLNLEANSDNDAVVRAAAKLVQGQWQVELSPLKEGNTKVTVVARDQEGLKSAPTIFAVTVSMANQAPVVIATKLAPTVPASMPTPSSEELTVFALIREGNRYVGEQCSNAIVRIESEKSVASLMPNTWKLVYYDPGATWKANEVKFISGKMDSVKRPIPLFERISGNDQPLDRSKLNLDSDKALEIAINQKEVGTLNFKASQIRLERKGLIPVWKIRLWAAKRRNPNDTADVGEVIISAADGTVIRRDLHPNRVD